MVKDWWPDPEYNLGLSPIFNFVPDGFNKECENRYSHHNTLKNALKLFKKIGFTVERGDDV